MMTNRVFVDTSGWMAGFVTDEKYHALAQQELQSALRDPATSIYTTDHVIAELVALMVSRKLPRAKILQDVTTILNAPKIHKLYTDPTLFLEAWALLNQRPDKDWSLADAITMRHMLRLQVSEVLTNDHHFEQAGFVRLLK